MANEQGTISGHPRIDLDTVRETLAYMHDDMASAPDLARVHQALGRVLDEIAAIAPGSVSQRPPISANVVSIRAPRFVPWSASGSR